MLRKILHSRLVVAAVSCVALALSSSIAAAEDLCSIVPASYTGAKSDHPELTTAIETLEKYAIASWYTDRMSSQERSDMVSGLLSQCSEDTRLSIVVYGIPNKDCAAGLSSGGSVTSTSDYQAFLKELTDGVGDRKVLYVVEPDALGLLTQDGGCGASAGYLDNLKIAVAALSANANAELYVDVGYWMLAYGDSASKVATVMKELGSSGRVKGVTINTSNYRSTDECAGYCTNFQSAMGSSDMRCIVDTSRNYNGSPNSDWCNVPTAGVGKPPTSETGVSNLDYFMWIKPPGESDGECATGGTAAGSFYLEGFTSLWDQGYFVAEQGMPKIGDSSSTYTQSPATTAPASGSSNAGQTTSTATTAPSGGSSSWSQETTVGTVAPADTTQTEAPAATTATPYTATTTTVTTSPSTTAPVSGTASPSTTVSPVTTTTAPTAETASTTTQQSNATQRRTACKAKKRLRSL
ncbi:putative glycosyl hydrolase family 6 protein [Phytophthora sojae]|uniref:Glycosyl hydrolase family 6 protein n=1 Tax=Phytophthora sojae (strain P6497) TaxID=1094619 RepID=G4ZXL7_PHYSP|nr:putative glycosyl hydrolase family 6 protein [Phytophthora sojae]EGZ12580.1 putative glycosyl hydrolase family 6 protein [Phytophthora sojae]|eukprot:XP_009532913.1 putative glycosyl hydrolase family 6 protein [Phytophthora sojae]